MKHILFICTIVCCCGCQQEPSIAINKDRINHTDSGRSFTIYNYGNKDLVIERFTTSCECTTLTLQNGMRISAGDSLIVPVTIHKTNQDADGEIYITIKTNATPQLTSFHFQAK